MPRLRIALDRLNPSLPPEAISQAIDQLIRDRPAVSFVAANHEVYGLLKNGIPVSVSREGGGQKIERVRVIGRDNPAVNDFRTRSRVKLTIEDVLDQELPRAYTPVLYRQKCAAVFEHVYETYEDRGRSIYGIVG